MALSLRRSALIVGSVMLALTVLSAPLAFSASKTAPKSPGKPCSKVGLAAKSGALTLKCVKSGKKLTWRIVKTPKRAQKKVGASPRISATAKASSTVTTIPTQSAYNIKVTSSQWTFAFAYFVDGSNAPLHGVAGDSSVLYLPESKLIHFTLTSTDTTHGFWIPGLSIDNSMDPGVETHFDFTAKKTGTFLGRCNVSSCGRGHAGMTFTVKVVTPEDYSKYLSSLK